MSWVHRAFYEQALPWQMGPHGILAASRATRREAANSGQGVKLAPQLSVYVPPAPDKTLIPHRQVTILFIDQLG